MTISVPQSAGLRSKQQMTSLYNYIRSEPHYMFRIARSVHQVHTDLKITYQCNSCCNTQLLVTVGFHITKQCYKKTVIFE